jgi:carbonic anhydrase
LGKVLDRTDRFDKLCELNVVEQVVHVCQTSSVQEAWARNQPVTVHGWVYGLHDGIARDLGISIVNMTELNSRYETVVRNRYQQA